MLWHACMLRFIFKYKDMQQSRISIPGCLVSDKRLLADSLAAFPADWLHCRPSARLTALLADCLLAWMVSSKCALHKAKGHLSVTLCFGML